MARMLAWEAPTELASRPTWDVWPADCVAEVTCMVWLWAVLFSGGCFGARRHSDWQPKGVCDNSIFDETAGYWKLRYACMDLGGWGRLGVRLRQLLSCWFCILQQPTAVGPASQWLLRCVRGKHCSFAKSTAEVVQVNRTVLMLIFMREKHCSFAERYC
jgi:hypothetical protein